MPELVALKLNTKTRHMISLNYQTDKQKENCMLIITVKMVSYGLVEIET